MKKKSETLGKTELDLEEKFESNLLQFDKVIDLTFEAIFPTGALSSAKMTKIKINTSFCSGYGTLQQLSKQIELCLREILDVSC